MHVLQKLPGRIKSFFRHPDTHWILAGVEQPLLAGP